MKRILGWWLATLAVLVTLPGASADVEVKNPTSEESPAGSFIADAVRKEAGAEIAFLPAAEIGEAEGKLKPDKVAETLCYQDDTISVVTLTGLQVTQALERSVSLFPKKNRGFLQVSGLQFTFDPARPSGERIVSVKVGKDNLKEDRKYKVAMSGTLAGGALGYFKVWDKKQIEEATKTKIREAIDSYVKGGKSGPEPGERIRVKK
ncbi:MAG: 5'-nucleotidase C-terminal domain-containing protein [Armatimonadetes bacterium]|nr:5'-nucleotidase C-terminal domain-containing protein [Armatimonadota bacterium]